MSMPQSPGYAPSQEPEIPGTGPGPLEAPDNPPFSPLGDPDVGSPDVRDPIPGGDEMPPEIDPNPVHDPAQLPDF